jgi:hypothetical protein
LSVASGIFWMPLFFSGFAACLQIRSMQLPEPAFSNAELKGSGSGCNLSVTKLRHQVAHESGAVALAQLLVCFFSWKQPYGAPLVADKIHAKSLKTGKKEISTHVFGNFNAQKRKL